MCMFLSPVAQVTLNGEQIFVKAFNWFFLKDIINTPATVQLSHRYNFLLFLLQWWNWKLETFLIKAGVANDDLMVLSLILEKDRWYLNSTAKQIHTSIQYSFRNSTSKFMDVHCPGNNNPHFPSLTEIHLLLPSGLVFLCVLVYSMRVVYGHIPHLKAIWTRLKWWL